MELPNGRTPVELGEEMINICGICYSPLEGYPEEDETLSNDLERVESTQFQYHRWCLAKWAWTHDNDPGSPTSRLQPLEIEGLLNFRPREFEVGDLVYFIAGMSGHQHVVRMYNKLDGSVQFYEGPPPEERMVRARLLNGTEQFYEGARGEERVVRARRARGRPANALVRMTDHFLKQARRYHTPRHTRTHARTHTVSQTKPSHGV
jgi:hypothetical protein